MANGLRILLLLLAVVKAAHGGTITIDFEGLADGTLLSNQFGGLVFSNAEILSAGLGLNEVEFPPRSGANVAGNLGGAITIAFPTPVLSFSAFFTYSTALMLSAFDSLSNDVGTTNSGFSSNFTSSGNPPNEFLQVSFSGGISRVTVGGDPSNGPFVLDDVTLTTPGSAAPEPSAFAMTLSGLMLAIVFGRVGRGFSRR